MGLSIIMLTSKTRADDSRIWFWIDKKMYNVILAFLEVLTRAQSLLVGSILLEIKETSSNIILFILLLIKHM